MPTNRRRRQQRRRVDVRELRRGEVHHLESGMCLLQSFRGDLESFREAWHQHREEILAAFVARNPGKRPFAWWLLEHGKERPIVSGQYTPEQIDAERHDTRRRDTFTFLHSSHGLQEPETHYLRRHGLLSADEEHALAGMSTNARPA